MSDSDQYSDAYSDAHSDAYSESSFVHTTTCPDCLNSQYSDDSHYSIFFRWPSRRALTRKEKVLFYMCNLVRNESLWKDAQQLDKWEDLAEEYAIKNGIEDGADLEETVLDVLLWFLDFEREFFVDGQFSIGIHDGIATATGNSAISEDIRQQLIKDSHELYLLFGGNLDYEPDSNDNVIVLVDPTLFPVHYDRSLLRHTLEPIPLPEPQYAYQLPQSGYQCLATLWDYSPETNEFKITSYINNLHPVKYQSLYATIEAVFNRCIPALNYVLSRLCSRILELETQPYANYVLDLDEEEEGELLLTAVTLWSEGKQKAARDFLFTSYKDRIHHPEAYVAYPDTFSIDCCLQFNQLKTFTKMSNIELTPENPRYEDRIWSKDMVIENVVAVVVYFYDVVNVKQAEIEFAERYHEFVECPMHLRDAFIDKVYGLKVGDTMARTIGSYKVENGRVVVFPYRFPYKIQNCELDDKTKNGSIKMLTMFLLEPKSTGANTSLCVVPQQKEWYEDPSLKYLFPDDLGDSYEPQTMDEAREIRRKIVANSLEKRLGNRLDGLAVTLANEQFFEGEDEQQIA